MWASYGLTRITDFAGWNIPTCIYEQANSQRIQPVHLSGVICKTFIPLLSVMFFTGQGKLDTFGNGDIATGECIPKCLACQFCDIIHNDTTVRWYPSKPGEVGSWIDK